MSVIDRIQAIIAHEGLTVSSFARSIGVGDQTIRGIVVQRRNNPGYDVIVRILQTFDWLNPEWLITGIGEMRREKENMPTHNNDCVAIKELIQFLREKDARIEELIEGVSYYKAKYEILKEDIAQSSH